MEERRFILIDEETFRERMANITAHLASEIEDPLMAIGLTVLCAEACKQFVIETFRSKDKEKNNG